MSKAHDSHTCTCPSGDGSLRWPCPVHPPAAKCDCLDECGSDPAVQSGSIPPCARLVAERLARPDNNAVAALAKAMRDKLEKQRAKGYGGWDKPECSQQRLSDMLREHVAKGDPVDVANFCAFLHTRGEGIASSPQAAPAAPDANRLRAEILDHASKGSRLVRTLFNEPARTLSDVEVGDWIQRAQQYLTLPTQAAPAAVAVPTGWKLVPIEPTPAMLDAAARASMQHLLECILDPSKLDKLACEEMTKLTHASRYRSMLAATPALPATEPGMLPEPETAIKEVVELVADLEREAADVGYGHGSQRLVNEKRAAIEFKLRALLPVPNATQAMQAEPVALQMCSDLKPRTESEKAAYLAGVADGRMYAERDASKQCLEASLRADKQDGEANG